ncbi:hypothetical protein CEXT_690901 [Caerostris extrusa]|uniref:Uncharacterized protein n=1 Tax=Caerostris extrusa TaxID=172846 RepID=A0AAV4Y7P0_CAEEX|nr:hypothetical protein CEXT_690901 [Caerostris extrusa]
MSEFQELGKFGENRSIIRTRVDLYKYFTASSSPLPSNPQCVGSSPDVERGFAPGLFLRHLRNLPYSLPLVVDSVIDFIYVFV